MIVRGIYEAAANPVFHRLTGFVSSAKTRGNYEDMIAAVLGTYNPIHAGRCPTSPFYVVYSQE
jgi:hypothetical protein